MLQTAATLAALSILTATTAPAISRFMLHAKTIRATGEVKIVASTLNLLLNDLAENELPISPYEDGVIELLVSDGDTPAAEEGAQPWTRSVSDPAVGMINDYLLTNAVGFAPKEGGDAFGWDGPYIDRPIDSDPWGNRYGVSMARDNSFRAVVSAGPDGILEQPFWLELSELDRTFGDDIVYPLH